MDDDRWRVTRGPKLTIGIMVRAMDVTVTKKRNQRDFLTLEADPRVRYEAGAEDRHGVISNLQITQAK